MQYDFECDCGNTQFFTAPIEIGPPESMNCEECGLPMKRIFTTGFILKGSGWPGKTIREEKTGERSEEIERFEERADEKRKEQDNSNEVLAERRKGRSSFKEYKKKNPDKVKAAMKALNKGIKGK